MALLGPIGGPRRCRHRVALLVNAAVALGLAYGDSSHFFSTTIGHGEASGIALGLLVRTSLCYGVFALAMQRWTTIKAATGDAIVEFLVAAQLYEPAQRLAEGYTDADADADEGRLFDGEYALRRWVDDHRERSFVFERGGGSCFALCCRGANVERVSDVLAVVGDAVPPLHRPPPARRVGDAARRTVDRVRECGHLRRCRRRDAHPLLRLVAREDAAGKTMPAPSRSPSPTAAARLRGASAGGGRACVPIRAVWGGHPRARGGGGEQDPDQPRARYDLETARRPPRLLRRPMARRRRPSGGLQDGRPVGDGGAVGGDGVWPRLDCVLGDADGFEVVVPPGRT